MGDGLEELGGYMAVLVVRPVAVQSPAQGADADRHAAILGEIVRAQQRLQGTRQARFAEVGNEGLVVVEQASRARLLAVFGQVGVGPLTGAFSVFGEALGLQRPGGALDAGAHPRDLILGDDARDDAEPVDLHVHDNLLDVHELLHATE